MREIRPRDRIKGRVKLPGSKSYTQRAMVIATLAEGESELPGALISEDTCYLLDALTSLGAEVHLDGDEVRIVGTGGCLENRGRDFFLGNNGTAMRFLTTMVCLGHGNYTLTGVPRLLERPLGPLLGALVDLGVSVRSHDRPGFPPVTVTARGLPGGKVTFGPVESSQYISSLLISAPYARGDLEIELTKGIVSGPYIDLTLDAMRSFGVSVVRRGTVFLVPSGQRYKGRTYPIETDLSTASYFFLAAALSGGEITCENVNLASGQGDLRFLSVLEELGCNVRRDDTMVIVEGRKLANGEYVIDMGDIPDLVPTMAVLAAFRSGKTIITNCAHLRLKESDRLASLREELTKMNVPVTETADGLEIVGGCPRGAVIESHNDHRLAMAFAVAGLVVPGMQITGEDCVRKSFPGFWEELERL